MVQNRLKLAVGAGVLILLVAVMALIYWGAGPQTVRGEKTLEIQVILPEEEREFTLHTREETLGGALTEAGLAEGDVGPYGLFITTVDGVKAQEEERQWWQITREGEAVNTGADSTPIQDGERYELTLSTY